MNTIIERIKNDLKNDILFKILLPKIEYQIQNPHPKYGIISPMYSLIPCFFDYYDVEQLSKEQMNEADKVIKIVDDAFGFGWFELSIKISQERELRTNEMISDLKHAKNILMLLGS